MVEAVEAQEPARRRNGGGYTQRPAIRRKWRWRACASKRKRKRHAVASGKRCQPTSSARGKTVCIDGALPLHYACFDGDHPPGFVTLGFTEYPKGMRVRNPAGYLPLHMGCWIRSDVAGVEALLATYPGGVHEQDDREELLIHATCNEGVWSAVVALLLERDLGSVYATNKKGWTALACIARKKRMEYVVLERMWATTASPVQSLPAPTQANMEMLFPLAIMQVASMSSITSALN